MRAATASVRADLSSCNALARSFLAPSRSRSNSAARWFAWSRAVFRASASSASRVSNFARDCWTSRPASRTTRASASSLSWAMERARSRWSTSLLRLSREATTDSSSASRFFRELSFVSTAARVLRSCSVAASASFAVALDFRRALTSPWASSSSTWTCLRFREASRVAAALAASSSFTRASSCASFASCRAICAPFASESLRLSASSRRSWSSRAFASASILPISTFGMTGASSSSASSRSPPWRDLRAFSRSPIEVTAPGVRGSSRTGRTSWTARRSGSCPAEDRPADRQRLSSRL